MKSKCNFSFRQYVARESDNFVRKGIGTSEPAATANKRQGRAVKFSALGHCCEDSELSGLIKASEECIELAQWMQSECKASDQCTKRFHF